jgi:hypothetical protein
MKSRDSPVASHSTVSGADTSTTTRKKFERRGSRLVVTSRLARTKKQKQINRMREFCKLLVLGGDDVALVVVVRMYILLEQYKYSMLDSLAVVSVVLLASCLASRLVLNQYSPSFDHPH